MKNVRMTETRNYFDPSNLWTQNGCRSLSPELARLQVSGTLHVRPTWAVTRGTELRRASCTGPANGGGFRRRSRTAAGMSSLSGRCGGPGSGDQARDHFPRAVRSAGRGAVCNAWQKWSCGPDPCRSSADAREIRRAAECGPHGGGGRHERFCAAPPFQGGHSRSSRLRKRLTIQ